MESRQALEKSLRERIDSLELELSCTRKAGEKLKTHCYNASDKETDRKRITSEQEQVS